MAEHASGRSLLYGECTREGLSTAHPAVERPKRLAHPALRGAVLPVEPLDTMGRTVGACRFAQGRKEGVFAEAREEPEALQLVLDRILHLGKAQLDAGGVQGVVELA